jgi:hypothetical protein
MKSRLNLKPGQKGTKQLVARYGAALLYVRYRYDEQRGVRLKTVELVVEEKPWSPATVRRDNEPVAVRVGYGETTLRAELKRLGAQWDATDKLWHIPYSLIRGSELEKRIVQPPK